MQRGFVNPKAVVQLRSRLKTWPGSSQARRAEPSLFTFSLVRVSALMSLRADICGLFQRERAAVALAAERS